MPSLWYQVFLPNTKNALASSYKQKVPIFVWFLVRCWYHWLEHQQQQENISNYPEALFLFVHLTISNQITLTNPTKIQIPN